MNDKQFRNLILTIIISVIIVSIGIILSNGVYECKDVRSNGYTSFNKFTGQGHVYVLVGRKFIKH